MNLVLCILGSILLTILFHGLGTGIVYGGALVIGWLVLIPLGVLGYLAYFFWDIKFRK